MPVRKRIRLAQNFLSNKSLVNRLIEGSELTDEDLVVDFGAGSGVITEALAKKVNKVDAVEIDHALAEKLKSKFLSTNVHVLQMGLESYFLPKTDYCVFSNPPFNKSAELLKKLFFSNNPPRLAYFILQKETIDKYAGRGRETEVSVILKVDFEVSSTYEFSPDDFVPEPGARVQLLKIKRRPIPLLALSEKQLFIKFINFAFHKWKRNLKLAFKNVFTYTQWKRLAKDLKFSLVATPSELRAEQWVALYKFYRAYVNKPLI